MIVFNDSMCIYIAHDGVLAWICLKQALLNSISTRPLMHQLPPNPNLSNIPIIPIPNPLRNLLLPRLPSENINTPHALLPYLNAVTQLDHLRIPKLPNLKPPNLIFFPYNLCPAPGG